MRIPIDRSSEVPVWHQIEMYLRGQIQSGLLPRGTRLPATRDLASSLAVSRGTVERAYLALNSHALIVTRLGSGTFVSDAAAAVPAMDTPEWTDPISFTGAGDPALFPVREFGHAIGDVIRRDGAAVFAYGSPSAGDPSLRATIAQMLAAQGIRARPDSVIVTSGSQQGLAIVCEALAARGDTVLVERPTYDGALALFRDRGLQVVAVDVDAHGMRTDQLAEQIAIHRPKLIYSIPTFQNPTGASMPLERRRALIEIADAFDVAIVEDDYAGDLRYDGPAVPALTALDDRGRVVYLGTFSKMLMPGVRVGFVVADGPFTDRVVALKHSHDLATSPLLQAALNRYVTVGRYQAHLRICIRRYRNRRDAMIEQLRTMLPSVRPAPCGGGLFLWVELADGVEASRLRATARHRGVDFAPGTIFHADPSGGERFIRLNFAVHNESTIATGVTRLAQAYRDVATGET